MAELSTKQENVLYLKTQVSSLICGELLVPSRWHHCPENGLTGDRFTERKVNFPGQCGKMQPGLISENGSLGFIQGRLSSEATTPIKVPTLFPSCPQGQDVHSIISGPW